MATQLGTLTGLIADLEELHCEEYFEYEEAYQGEMRCGEDESYWPCPTMQIVHKHKGIAQKEITT